MADTRKNQPTPPREEPIRIAGSKSSERAVSRDFPGPPGASALLRVAVERAAYADLIAHAKGSLDREICGALAGNICDDGNGRFVSVAAVIPGLAASQGTTHVTFTQETWNQIHETLEKEHPKLQMVGWYHSHPGFGVEFSEMDLFIQRNFFSGPTQIALVIDPLTGAVAICVNTSSGIEYLDRFWVDGREQLSQAPKSKTPPAAPPLAVAADAEGLRALEARVGQLIQALDDQRASYNRFLTFCGIVLCLGVIACFGYTYYSNFRYRVEPPKMTQFAPVPIKVGDKNVMLGVGIAEWQVPDELNAVLVELERQKQKEAAEATNGPTLDSTNLSKPK